MTPHKTKDETLTPAKIMQIGMGFWPSKVLLSAVRLRLFTILGAGALSGAEIKRRLGFHCTDRHVYDWLDALVSLGFLQREGLLETARYSNAADTGLFLDRNKPSYMGGILEMANSRLYKHWANLEDGLISGTPQNEGKDKPGGNMGFFGELYADPQKLQEFIDAMSGFQTGNFAALVEKFDFGKYRTMLDVGGADGWLSIQVCLRHPNIGCTTFDLPPVEPLAKRKISAFDLSGRIQTASGDLVKDPFPAAQLITMGNVLHGFDEAMKQTILRKAYNSLPEGGAFMAIENVIDNDRRQNTFGLLMSMNMLIENGDSFDYTANDFEGWAKAAGFKRVEIIPLAGPTSAAVAYK
jgi:O-methyltransferase domain/Dimerisation domain